MANILVKKESNSGKTTAIIQESENGFMGTVTYDDNNGDVDTDTQEFTTLPDAEGWLELTFMFMLGVHADM